MSIAMKPLLFSTLIALAFSATSAAALTTIKESAAGTGAFPTGGDYANAPGASTNLLGNVPLGDIEIIGDLRGTSDSGGNDFADWFFFTLMPGREITSFSITSAPTSSSGTVLKIIVLDSNGDSVIDTPDFLARGTSNFSSRFTPLASGTYNFGLLYRFGSTERIDYTLNASVSEIAPIPLPAGLPLLIAGLGAFGLIRRGRK